MIKINNATYSYGKTDVLVDISLQLPPKSLTALIGLNGAGKSTLLSCLSKQNELSSGEIWVAGKNLRDYSFIEYSKIVSLVPQHSALAHVDYKVRDFLVEGRTPYLSPFATPNIKEYLFSEKIAAEMNIEHYLDKDFNKLSGGEQQLVLIARALVQDTPILLLDEPMSSLDLKNQALFLKTIKELSKQGKTIIFSTHNPNHAFALSCDVCILHGNHVLGYGKASEVLTNSTIQDIYGSSVRLFKNTETYCGIVTRTQE